MKNDLRVGDRVIVRGYLGTISSAYSDYMGTYIYKIELDDGTVYESTEEYIIKSVFPGMVDTETYCPKCEEKWHKSQLGMHVWYDCLTCRKRKEDILSEK